MANLDSRGPRADLNPQEVWFGPTAQALSKSIFRISDADTANVSLRLTLLNRWKNCLMLTNRSCGTCGFSE